MTRRQRMILLWTGTALILAVVLPRGYSEWRVRGAMPQLHPEDEAIDLFGGRGSGSVGQIGRIAAIHELLGALHETASEVHVARDGSRARQRTALERIMGL